MSTEIVEPTLEELIADALARDPRLNQDQKSLEVLSLYVPPTLVEAIGPSLDSAVDLESLCEVTAAFLCGLVDTDFFVDLEYHFGKSLYLGLAEELESMSGNLSAFLAQQGITEQEAMHQDSLGLNEESLRLYDAGELTYRVLATTQPGVFIPRS